MLRERSDTRDVLRRVAGVPNLDAIQADLAQRLETCARRLSAGVSEHRYATRLVYERDGVAHWKVILVDVSRSAKSKPAVEGFPLVARASERYDCASDVGPADRTLPGILEYPLHGNRYSELLEPLHDPLRARATALAKSGEAGLHDFEARDVQPEHVHLSAVVRAQLDAWYDADTQCFTRLRRRRNARERIVIGERDRIELRSRGGLHHFRGRQRAVRCGGVHVQVHQAALR